MHEGFREYLAADFLRNRSSIFIQTILEHLLNPDWEQVTLLAGAHADLPEDLREELLESIVAKVQTLEPGSENWVRYLVIAGKLTNDMALKLPAPSREMVIETLKDASFDIEIASSSRVQVADALDALYLPKDLQDFIPIPNSQAPWVYIAKYPVTNVQYRRFLEADDYLDTELWQGFPKFDEKGFPMPEDWGDAGLEWLKKLPSYRSRDTTGMLYPEYWSEPRFGITRQAVPVVGVSWYEANAFCKWLQRHWNDPDLGYAAANPDIPMDGMTIRLPLEGEWIAAAGGDDPAERYPWDIKVR